MASIFVLAGAGNRRRKALDDPVYSRRPGSSAKSNQSGEFLLLLGDASRGEIFVCAAGAGGSLFDQVIEVLPHHSDALLKLGNR
jgi:hypothetical protein